MRTASPIRRPTCAHRRCTADGQRARHQHDRRGRHALRLDRLQRQRRVRQCHGTGVGRRAQRHEQRPRDARVPGRAGSFTGTTYARFRLSTDAAAANPTGAAADGEVEDYRVTITQAQRRHGRQPRRTRRSPAALNGGPALANGDMFGSSVAALGDLDGDGVADMAVGAPSEFGTGSGGAVHVLFMNANGTVKSSQKIGSGIGGGPTLADGDYFGHSVASLGDLDGDGVTDLAVGADKDDTGGYNRGAVYVLFMNANGTVKSSQKIASGIGGGPALANGDRFGSSVTSLGDLDGDGVARPGRRSHRATTRAALPRRGACAVHERQWHGQRAARRSPAASVAARRSPNLRRVRHRRRRRWATWTATA